jgi:hypothetical protein
VDRRVTLLFNAATHILALLEHYHLLQQHHPTRKPKERRKCIQKFEDGYCMATMWRIDFLKKQAKLKSLS